MPSAFVDSLDIANRACDHLGVSHIKSVDEDSPRNEVISSVYDKLRQAELRRNVWVFAIRKAPLRSIDASTRLLAPDDWRSDTLYFPGSLVTYQNGQIWISMQPENLDNEPGVTGVWEHYFGPMTVAKYSTTVPYNASELVWIAGALAGSFVVYMSLVSANKTAPDAATAWDVATLYKMDDVVSYSGAQWRSVIVLNQGVTPALVPLDWSAVTSYNIADLVVAADGFVWSSVGNTNVNHDPAADTTGTYWTNTGVAFAWSKVPGLQPAGTSWLPIFTNLGNIGIEAITTGLGTTKSTFHVPSGFLRKANPNPRLVLARDDEDPIAEYILSVADVNIMEFCADITDVRKMDPMFCEGLGCRIAIETCQTLTQSEGKIREAVSMYGKFMVEARTVNAIEVGTEEPEEDEFITVRNQTIPGTGFSGGSFGA